MVSQDWKDRKMCTVTFIYPTALHFSDSQEKIETLVSRFLLLYFALMKARGYGYKTYCALCELSPSCKFGAMFANLYAKYSSLNFILLLSRA